jgi:integrase
MSVFKMKDRDRPQPWCCEVRRVRTYFKTKQAAKEHEAREIEINRNIDLGYGITKKVLERYTVREIILNYIYSKPITKEDELYNLEDDDELDEEESDLPNNDFWLLWNFSRLKICEKNLHEFKEQQVAKQYIKERLKDTWKPKYSLGDPKPITPRTVQREKIKIGNAWKAAAEKIPELKNLLNPWQGIRIPDSTVSPPARSLREGELEKLIEHCNGCLGLNRYYVPLAIYLAIDTGMRRQEIANLLWEEIDFDRRRIKIIKSKTKEGVNDIVLPFMPELLLIQLKASLQHHGRLPGPSNRILVGKPGKPGVPEGRIFRGMTKEALTQAFRDVVKRAGLRNITFRSTLRTTANSRFDNAELTDKQLDIMMRHAGKSVNAKNYTDRDEMLEKIRERLDRYLLKGKIPEDMLENKEERMKWMNAVRQNTSLQASRPIHLAEVAALATATAA